MQQVGRDLMIVGITSSIAFVVVGIFIGTYLWKQRRIAKKRKGNSMKMEPELLNSNLHFSYSALEKATENFSTSNKLGRGGFGIVYKGVLADGREVAVKRLLVNNTHRIADFYNEVNMISKVEHKNLLRLLGCSCTGPECLLVYEYAPNQSLDRFIFGMCACLSLSLSQKLISFSADTERGKLLNWEKRMNIIIGTAEGLVDLHENRDIKIIHRDIKASNVLLDSKFQAKIADFGLARSFEDDRSHITTVVAGTLGYLSPEYIAHGQLTEKADVYSFGILLLEIVSGVQNNQSMVVDDIESVLSAAWRHFQSETIEKMIDPNLMGENTRENEIITSEAHLVVHVGLLCTQEASALRPSMKTALEMLLKRYDSLPTPSRPPFLDETRMEFNDFFANSSRPLNSACSAAIVADSSLSYPR